MTRTRSRGRDERTPAVAANAQTPATRDRTPAPMPAAVSEYGDIPPSLVEALRYFVARRLLLDNRFPSPLGVTSAVRREGVTTASRALAGVLADETDERVCWVDLSWAAGHGAPGSDDSVATPGLYEALTEQVSLDAALAPTRHPRLFTLGAGAMPVEQRSIALRLPAFADAIGKLAQSHQVVLDVPAVLDGSEGLAAMRSAEAYLLVVRHNATTIDQVRAAHDALQNLPSVGVVLNRYRSRIPKRIQRFMAR